MNDLQSRFADNRMSDNLHLICSCGLDEHQITFSMDDYMDDYAPEFYISYHLQSDSFLKRIKNAFKHIFGFKSRYGDFGNMLLTLKDADEIIDFLQKYKTQVQNWYIVEKQIPLFDMKEIDKQSNLAKLKEE